MDHASVPPAAGGSAPGTTSGPRRRGAARTSAEPISAPRLVLPVASITDGDRLRPVDPDKVAQIAKSFSEVGQIADIEVRAHDDGWLLVAGAHRLAAARQLGWATIAATVFAGSDDLALLREIDENLYRHTLNPLDEAVFLAMRAEIYRRLHPETAQWKGRLGQHAGPGAVPKARPFAADVAERTGIGRRTVERALTRFARLSPAARDAIRGTEIARSGAAIDLLCDIAPAHQAPVAQAALAMPPRQPIVKRLASAKAVELELAAPAVPDPLERAWVAYTRLSVEDRHTFIDRMRERGYLHRRRTGLVD